MEASRIRVLPDELINQIAAGEVVERPASVVKELVENAIDANATRCIVEIEKGGLGLIKVHDNGSGMTPEDLVLCLRRHATSKIATLEDLYAIHSLGFRGEALPSIASVSKLTIYSRTPSQEHGFIIEAGQNLPKPYPCPVGTTVIVKDLFYNVPARLKFQKGERSQVSGIEEVLLKIAGAYDNLHVTLISSGRVLIDLPSCNKFIDRVTMIFGKDLAKHLFEFHAETEGVRIEGIISDPEKTRQDSSKIFIIVNGRPVFDPSIRRTLIEAYSILPSGKFPHACIRIEVNSSDVDVNVHPQKTEVRFKNPKEVLGVLFRGIHDLVTKTPWVKRVSMEIPRFHEISSQIRESALQWDVEPKRKEDHKGETGFRNMRYVGQVGGVVLIVEGQDSLVLIDQHAAFERVTFERLWEDVTAGKLVRERLLFPEIISLEKDEIARYEEEKETLERLGFDIEVYSGDSIVVKGIPSIMKGKGTKEVILSLLRKADTDFPDMPKMKRMIATIACHCSIRAGDKVSEEDVKRLLYEMDRIDFSTYCPHGRLAVVVYPLSTVLRWFGR